MINSYFPIVCNMAHLACYLTLLAVESSSSRPVGKPPSLFYEGTVKLRVSPGIATLIIFLLNAVVVRCCDIVKGQCYNLTV